MVSLLERERLLQLKTDLVSLGARWRGKAGYTLADQIFFGGSNTLITLLLGRWLTPERFGAFTTSFSIFLLFAALHTAVMSEPMLVYGSTKYEKDLPEYIRALIFIHFILTFGASLLTAGISLFLYSTGSYEMAYALFGLALAMPFFLSQWLMRRACYSVLKPGLAATGSVLYFILMLGAIVAGRQLHIVTPFFAWAVFGLSGLVVSIWISIRLKINLLTSAQRVKMKEVITDHWQFGSWNLLGTMVYWFSGQIILILIPILLSLEASGKVSAALNLFSPLNSVMMSASILLLPVFSRLYLNGDSSMLSKQAVLFSLPIAGLVAAYGFLIAIFSGTISQFIYAGNYPDLAPLIFLFSISYAASSIVTVFTIVMKAAKKVRFTFYVWSASAIFTCIFSVPLIMRFGLLGAIFTLIASYSIAGVIAYVQIQKLG